MIEPHSSCRLECGSFVCRRCCGRERAHGDFFQSVFLVNVVEWVAPGTQESFLVIGVCNSCLKASISMGRYFMIEVEELTGGDTRTICYLQLALAATGFI